MTITVNTASTATRLTTVQRVGEILNSTGIADDVLFEKLIDRASAFMENYCNRTFAREVITETMGSAGAHRLVLSRTPINSVTFIENDGSSISSTSYEIEDSEAGFVWREGGWKNTSIRNFWIEAWDSRSQRKDFSIKYDAGYYLPDSTAPTFPADLEHACIEIVKSWYLDKDFNRNIRRERIGDAWIERYANENVGGVPASVLSVLDQYRRLDLVF